MNTFNEDWLSQILLIATEASNAINDVYARKTYNIDSKLDKSPVTEADLLAHHIIKNGLGSLQPFLPILSEEGEPIPFEIRSNWSKYWLVDPLDGTKEFIKGTGEFTINIALIENHIPVFGIVVVPTAQHYYWAFRGKDAYLQVGEQKERIHSRLHSPLRIVLSRRFEKVYPLPYAWLSKIGKYELSYCGSALKICLIAKGELDLYPQLGKTSEWDIAAGQCILEAAGGQIVDLNGEPLKYNTRTTLENPQFYALSDSSITPICCG